MFKTKLNSTGFIMDGNRRWAKGEGLPTLEGHRRGHQVFLDSLDWVCEARIAHAVYYAFSTENWKRTEKEVSYLMDLFRKILSKISKEQKKREIKVRIIGRWQDFAEDIQQSMSLVESLVEENNRKYQDSKTTIWIALSYGGRVEIVEAVNKAVEKGQSVTEESFEKLLWTAELPDPDLIVRTSGEQRLSNFLTWRLVYSELLFIDKHWPSLTKDDFDGMLKEYKLRKRRRGK